MRRRMMMAAAASRVSIDQFFSNSEKGVWYDPSDLSTMFQDTGATTPVTTDGDPVRYMMDKSGNAVNLSNATGVVYKTDGTFHWLEHSGTYLVASGSKTKMKFAHGATGFTGCYGFRLGVTSNPDTGYGLYSNNGGTSNKIGVSGFYDDRSSVPRNEKWIAQASIGSSGNWAIDSISPDGAITPNLDNYMSEVFNPSNSPSIDRHLFRVNGGADTKSNVGTATPSSLDSSDDLTIGALSASLAFPLTGRIYQFVMVEGQLSEDQRTNLEAAVSDKTP